MSATPSRIRRARCHIAAAAVAAATQCGFPQHATARPVRAPTSSNDVTALLTQASEHFAGGRYRQALELFDAVLARAPETPERATVAFNAAVCTYALEDYADARVRFEAIALQFPELSALARVNAGFAALRAGDLDAAATFAGSPAPSSADVEQRRLDLLQELQAARDARTKKELESALDAGFDAITRKQWLLARAKLTRAIAAAAANDSDDLADAHYGLGVIAAELGQSEVAQRHFERSIEYRPGDPRALLALGRAAEDGADRVQAETAYETALALPMPEDKVADTQRSLFRLYRLPSTGPSALVSFGVGHDDNAAQSGSGDVTSVTTGDRAQSAYIASTVDLGMTLRASRRSAFGLNYSGDLLALLNPSVEDLSLQAHELVGRLQWAPDPSLRLRLDAGAAYVLTGLNPTHAFEWDGVLVLRADVDTSGSSRARLQLSERLVRGSELSYLDGHRVDLLLAEVWQLNAWELSLQGSFRYNGAGLEKIELASDAFAACDPNCDRGPYRNALSYWSPAASAGVAWSATAALRFSLLARGEYRGYLDTNGISSIRASRKTRQDIRLRGRLGGELSLDDAGLFRLTLDQSLLVSRSNVAFDANDPGHQLDYGDRNFVQQTTELGVVASFL